MCPPEVGRHPAVVAGPGDFAAAIGDTTAVPAGSYFASTNDFTGVVATTNPSTSLNGAVGHVPRRAGAGGLRSGCPAAKVQ